MTDLFTEADLTALGVRSAKAHPEIAALGARKRKEAQGADILGNLFSEEDLARLGASVDEPRHKAPENMSPLEKAAAMHAQSVVTGDVTGRIDEGIDLKQRVGAGFKFDKQGVYNYLRETYGGANVTPVRDPNSGGVINFAIRDKDGKIKVADPEGFDPGDAADMVRDIAEGVPGAAGAAAGAAAGTAVMPGIGTAVGGILGSMAGDAAGSAGVQAIGKALPGSEAHVQGRDRLISGGANVAGGLLGEAGGLLAKGVFKTAPRAALRSAVIGGGEEAVKEGLALEARTGVNMSAPALANTPRARSFEQMLAQRPGTANVIVGANQKSAQQMGAYLDKTFDAQLGQSVGGEAAGKNAGKAFRGAADKLIEQRDATAAELFGAVDAIAGSDKIVSAKPLKAKLRSIIAELRPEVHTTGMRSEASEFEYLLNTIPDDGMMTAKNFQRLLSKTGKAAQGSGKLFKDLELMDDKRAAKQIYGVLMDTLDQSVMMPTKGSRLAATTQKAMSALAQARDSYKAMSAQIGELDQVMVEKAFKLSDAGKAEFLPRDIMAKGMSDENVRSGFAVLRAADPAAANSLVRSSLEHDLAELAPKTGIAAGADVPLDPGRFARWQKEKRPRLAAMLGADSPVLKAIDDTAEVGRRLGPISSDINSQTSRMFWYKQLYDNFKGGDLGFIGALQSAASLSTSKGIAETLTNPAKRDLFLGLINPKRSLTLNAAKDMAARLLALDARGAEMGGDVVEPQSAPQPEPRPIAANRRID